MKHRRNLVSISSHLTSLKSDKILTVKEKKNKLIVLLSCTEHEILVLRFVGGSVAEWLERWTCNSEAPSSSPALTVSWICSR